MCLDQLRHELRHRVGIERRPEIVGEHELVSAPGSARHKLCRELALAMLPEHADDTTIVETFVGETTHTNESAAAYARVMDRLWNDAATRPLSPQTQLRRRRGPTSGLTAGFWLAVPPAPRLVVANRHLMCDTWRATSTRTPFTAP